MRVVALRVTFLNPQTRAVGCRRVADRVMGIRRRLVCCMLHGQCDAPCPQSMHHNTSITDVCRLLYWRYARDCSSQLRIPVHLRCRHIFPFYHPFSHSHHAPHQPHSLASRLVASSSTPRARSLQRDVSQERELCVLWIARHLSCILTLPTARTEPPTRQRRVSICDLRRGRLF